MNPIALPDLGDRIAETLLDKDQIGTTLSVGGPEIFKATELTQVAEHVLGKKVKVRKVPRWLTKMGLAVLRIFNKKAWEQAQFVANGPFGNTPMIGQKVGHIRLEDYFRQRLEAEGHEVPTS
jgi:uncharacterized protein YbjT (DUF2867 family)